MVAKMPSAPSPWIVLWSICTVVVPGATEPTVMPLPPVLADVVELLLPMKLLLI